jgi:hypothetical protein
MVARGFAGRLPVYGDEQATPRQWLVGMTVPAATVILALLSLTVL